MKTASRPVAGRFEPFLEEPPPEPEEFEPDDPELEPDPPELVPPPPEDEATTFTVPFMLGWTLQMYEKVPALSKVCEPLLPFPNVPVSNVPPLPVAEWGAVSLLVQVT